MKFLCVDCDRQMVFEERQVPADGTLTVAFRCPMCRRTIAMLTNPTETQLVESLGVKLGGRPPLLEPMELIRSQMAGGRQDAFADEASAARAPRWDEAARHRLDRVPSFVRATVSRVYDDYAAERGIGLITPDVMDRARRDLGLEGM